MVPGIRDPGGDRREAARNCCGNPESDWREYGRKKNFRARRALSRGPWLNSGGGRAIVNLHGESARRGGTSLDALRKLLAGTRWEVFAAGASGTLDEFIVANTLDEARSLCFSVSFVACVPALFGKK